MEYAGALERSLASETASSSSTKHNRDVGPLRSFRTNQSINHSINQSINQRVFLYV